MNLESEFAEKTQNNNNNKYIVWAAFDKQKETAIFIIVVERSKLCRPWNCPIPILICEQFESLQK